MNPSARQPSRRARWEAPLGLALVAALHAVGLHGLWTYRLLPEATEFATLFVSLIDPKRPPPEPARPEPPKQVKLEKPRPAIRPQPRQLVAETPVISPAEPVAPQFAPVPPAPEKVAAPPAPPPMPAGPVRLDEELAVSCPERVPPQYPARSRRHGEHGTVVLRVELDERGHVSAARVSTSSGWPRLDEAALGAVRQWRCNPAYRNGVAVRAVALQPFHFVLEGQ